MRFLSNPIGFGSALFDLVPPIGETVARVPIARLIDSDRYEGEALDANTTLSPVIGLAEFSNANFFSENTVAGHFPFPRRQDLTVSPRVAPRADGIRRYFSKPAGQGLPTNVALAECGSERSIARWITGRTAPYPCVDEAVWEETATHMLPRAVGYARGVLDYFFRGRLAVRQVLPRSAVMLIDIENRSNEPMTGTFEVYARHAKGTAGERRELAARVNDGQSVSLAPGQWNRFSLPMLTGDPTAFHVLVFRGQLGNEAEAVAGHVFTVPHVQILPTSYTADLGGPACTLSVATPTTDFPLRETLGCRWTPITHRVEADIRTNFGQNDPSNPVDPAIERIEAFWQGGVAGPAPLTVNGVTHATGVWQRAGGEPDPVTVGVTDTTVRGSARLMLRVTARGLSAVTVDVPTFTTLSRAHWKHVFFLSSGWRIRSGRLTIVTPNVPSSSALTVESIGGYPYPTSILNSRESISVTSNILQVRYASHDIFDTEEMVLFGPGITFHDVEAKYRSLVLVPQAVPVAPEVEFSATAMSRRLGASMEKFWSAFVGGPDPSTHTMTLRAQVPAAAP